MSTKLLRGIVLVNALIGGTITGTAFNTKLGDASWQAGWDYVISLQTPLRRLAASATGMNALVESGKGVKPFLESPHFKANVIDVPANYTNLKNAAALAASKLKRQVFTASGTWTMPASLLAFLAVVVGGGGGGAGTDTGATVGRSGGAGQFQIVTPALPTADITITVGAGGAGGPAGGNGGNGGSSSLGAIASSVGGTGGEYAGNAGTGGSSGTLSGTASDITDPAVATGVWQLNAVNLKGPDGTQLSPYAGGASYTTEDYGKGGDSYAAGTNKAGDPGVTGAVVVYWVEG